MFRVIQAFGIVWVLVTFLALPPSPEPPRREHGDTYALHGTQPAGQAATAVSPASVVRAVPRWKRVDAGSLAVYVLPGTAADRDVERLSSAAQRSLRRVERRLGIRADEPLELYFVERVFWQGGAAYNNGEILISYPDRSYTGIPLWVYLDHEITHALAQSLVPANGQTNTLLAEGLAVWVSGGHYDVEPIHQLAAAVARSDGYVPIRRLLRDFRAAQHEIAYIEAGSFVAWLIETRGVERVKRLYGRANRPEDVLGRTYAELEREWLTALALQPAGYDTVRYLALQIRAFDVMRSYQTTFDPLAREVPESPIHWSDADRARYQDNVDAPINIALETLIGSIQGDIQCWRLQRAARRLPALERSVQRGAVYGREIQARRVIAEQLVEQDHALQSGDVEAYLETVDPGVRDMIASLLFQYVADARQEIHQETAYLALSPETQRAEAGVWWISSDGARSFQSTFAVSGEQWRLVAMRETELRSQDQCNALPMESTIRRRTAW